MDDFVGIANAETTPHSFFILIFIIFVLLLQFLIDEFLLHHPGDLREDIPH